MKRSYSRPVFYAEEYTFSSSIAKCDLDIDTTDPLTFVVKETNVCLKPNGDGTYTSDGHVYGGNNGDKGAVREAGGADVITVFNDGISENACQYDWDGRKNIVAQTGQNFQRSFVGTNADFKNHAPGYEGLVFLS